MITHNNIISNSFKFYNKSTLDLIAVDTINLDSDGKIKYITDINGNIIDNDSYVYTNLILDVPGLGYALCGDSIILKLKNKVKEQIGEYILGFGWHINISNQKIYSWYLLPTDKRFNTPDVDLIKAKTLYYEDLINIVGITRQMQYILPSDLQSE